MDDVDIGEGRYAAAVVATPAAVQAVVADSATVERTVVVVMIVAETWQLPWSPRSQ